MSDSTENDINAEVVGMLREAARRVTGGNCTFVDDDLAIIEHLASRAVSGGLTDMLAPDVQRDCAKAIPPGSYPSAPEPPAHEGEQR